MSLNSIMLYSPFTHVISRGGPTLLLGGPCPPLPLSGLPNFKFRLLLTQFKPNTLTLFSTKPNKLKHLGNLDLSFVIYIYIYIYDNGHIVLLFIYYNIFLILDQNVLFMFWFP